MRSKDTNGKELFGIETYAVHHFFHVIGIVVCSVFTLSIFNIQDNWLLLLAVSIILAVLGYIYNFA